MIQAVLFNKDLFTLSECYKYLRQHDLIPIKYPHYTLNFIRFRITPPYYKNYFIKRIRPGIEYVIGY